MNASSRGLAMLLDRRTVCTFTSTSRSHDNLAITPHSRGEKGERMTRNEAFPSLLHARGMAAFRSNVQWDEHEGVLRHWLVRQNDKVREGQAIAQCGPSPNSPTSALFQLVAPVAGRIEYLKCSPNTKCQPGSDPVTFLPPPLLELLLISPFEANCGSYQHVRPCGSLWWYLRNV